MSPRIRGSFEVPDSSGAGPAVALLRGGILPIGFLKPIGMGNRCIFVFCLTILEGVRPSGARLSACPRPLTLAASDLVSTRSAPRVGALPMGALWCSVCAILEDVRPSGVDFVFSVARLRMCPGPLTLGASDLASTRGAPRVGSRAVILFAIANRVVGGLFWDGPVFRKNAFCDLFLKFSNFYMRSCMCVSLRRMRKYAFMPVRDKSKCIFMYE